MDIKINVSIGELIDKITILEIKQNNIKDPKKLSNVNYELSTLNVQLESLNLNSQIYYIKQELLSINKELWTIEDKLRLHENNKEFDKRFVELARLVYKLNDKRSKLKKDINMLCNSSIIEEKSYSTY